MSPQRVAAFVVAVLVGGVLPVWAQHDSHGSGPAAHVAPGKPSSTPTDASKHATPSSPAAVKSPSPGSDKGRHAAENQLSSAISRIQERIATETGPSAKPTTTATNPAIRRANARAAAPSVAQSVAHRVAATPAPTTRPAGPKPARLVTLEWRISLEWPAELQPASAAEKSPTIELKW